MHHIVKFSSIRWLSLLRFLNTSTIINESVCVPQGWYSKKNMMGGGSESLRISFLEAVYGFRVSFLSLSIFLRYEFDVIAVSGAVCTFY